MEQTIFPAIGIQLCKHSRAGPCSPPPEGGKLGVALKSPSAPSRIQSSDCLPTPGGSSWSPWLFLAICSAGRDAVGVRCCRREQTTRSGLRLCLAFSSCELAQVSADTLSLSWAAWSTFLLLWISSCNLKMSAQRFNKNKGLTVKAGLVLHGTVPSFRENEIYFLG